jgi:hypothetical protein
MKDIIMYKSFVSFLVILGLCLLTPVGCKVEPEITVSDDVLKTAKVMGVDYLPLLEKAKTGDVDAIRTFFEFHRFADGLDGFAHGQTCLELIPFAQDDKVAAGCANFKPGMKKLILERLVLAQTRTNKEELKQPLMSWAHATYTVLYAPVQPIVKDSTAASQNVIKIDSLAKMKGVKPESIPPKK